MRTVLITSLLGALILFLGLGLTGRELRAEDMSRFQPPRPPPLDSDAFDPDEDDAMELGEEGFRPPPPPPPPGGAATGGGFNPPPSSVAPMNLNGPITSAKKFRFKLVEGEFYEKGKKRSRGALEHVTGSDEK